MWRIRCVLAVALALLPSLLKIPLYRRLFGYRIGKGVRIGFTPFLGVRSCRIGDHARIGSFNLFYKVEELEVGDHARVGFLNLFRGGERVRVGRYATVLRQNVFNAIIERDFTAPVSSHVDLGTGAVVTSGHWLDFSAGLRVGDHSIIGGRNSSVWTHNRQRGRSVSVGCHCYLGSEVRVAPGVELPDFCVVALGSVLSGRYEEPRTLVGGNPAAAVRPLRADDLFLVLRKTRNDMPDDVSCGSLPDDLVPFARRANAEPGDRRGERGFEPEDPDGESACTAAKESSL